MAGAKNIQIEEDKNTMIITLDKTKDLGPSKSGKTILVATTGGSIPVGDLMVNVNIYKPA